MPRRTRILAAAALGALALAPMASATIHTVSVGNNFFNPVNTTVSHGDTVRFMRSAGTHTSTSDAGSPKGWDSGILAAGVPFDVEIKPADGNGPFPFHCDFHPAMKGTIFVQSLGVQVESTDPLPRALALEQNFPNPFNPSTTIRFSLERSAVVRFAVVNLLGQTVESQELGELPAGSYEVNWTATAIGGKSLPSGVYFYTITAGEWSATRRMLLLK